MKRILAIVMLFCLLTGCAPAAVEAPAPVAAPVPTAEPTATAEPAPTAAPMAEPISTPLPSLPPYGERVYLREFDPPVTDFSEHEAPFQGKALSREEIETLRAELEQLDDWAALFGCLERFGISLAHLGKLTPEYRQDETSGNDPISSCQFETVGDDFAALSITGWLDGYPTDCRLYFQWDGMLYQPHWALLDEWYNNSISIVDQDVSKDTWLMEDGRVSGGTGYDHHEAVWYNLSKKAVALSYTSVWLDSSIAPSPNPEDQYFSKHIWLTREISTETEPPVAYEGGAFSIDVHADISATFEYYDDDWENKQDWRDVLETRFTYQLYYDPEAQDFYLAAGNAEPYYIRTNFPGIETALRLVDIAEIFREELEELSEDDLPYRANWAKLLLSELDEGEEGDEG